MISEIMATTNWYSVWRQSHVRTCVFILHYSILLNCNLMSITFRGVRIGNLTAGWLIFICVYLENVTTDLISQRFFGCSDLQRVHLYLVMSICKIIRHCKKHVSGGGANGSQSSRIPRKFRFYWNSYSLLK